MTQPSCIFCQIVHGKIPSPRLYEDDDFICIRDVKPQAKTHLLVLTKTHFSSLDALFGQGVETDQQQRLMGRLLYVCTQVA